VAISFIDQATGVDSATIPAHAAGDLLIAFAYRATSAVTPTIPAGWTTINSGAGNSNGHAAAWKLAASSSEVTGTWSNAETLNIHVYRGTDQTSPIGGQAQATNIATILFPALTMTIADGTSWVDGFAGIRIGNQPIETPPPGMVIRTDNVSPGGGTSREAAGFDTDGGVSSWSLQNGGSAGGSRFRSLTFEIIAAASAPTGITATAAITEADDTVSGAGALRIAATANITEASDTVASNGALKILANASISEANDTVTATASLRISGTAAISEANDTLASAGALRITANLTVTEANDTLSAVGGAGQVAGITATLTVTEANDTVTSLASLRISGTAAVTEANDTVASSGALRITANSALIEADDILISSSRVTIVANLAIVENDDTLTAIGRLDFVDPVTPFARTVVVRYENRTITVEYENRTIRVI